VNSLEIVVGAPMAAVLGFAYGMGPCLVSCAPFLGPVFLSSDGGIRNSWRIILPLSLGRLTAYVLFGAVAGEMGRFVKVGMAASSVHGIVGTAALLMGLALLWRKRGASGCLADGPGTGWRPLQRIDGTGRTMMPWALYMMGVGMALSPCAPLGIVLFSAAVAGSAGSGALLGVSFGLGAIIVPAIVYGIGMAYLGVQLRRQLRDWRPLVERASAVLLVLVGIGNLVRV
jgi:sulfite exporter TauE/SafE